VLRRVEGPAARGYQIHHGRVSGAGPGWVPVPAGDGPDDGDGPEGAVSPDGTIRGTTLHGLFEHDSFRAGFLCELASRQGKRFEPAGICFDTARTARFDVIADAIDAHLDVDVLFDLIAGVKG
jgi:adenosylcobyric acid synthase